MAKREALLAKAAKPAQDALRLHPFYRGKIQMLPKCPVRGLDDFAVWYTPGVAAPCEAIHAAPDLVYEYTNKANSIAIVSDGSRVLGLGNIGPRAGLPVMEGKALLFKYLGGVDAVPICLNTEDADEIVRTVELLEPTFGGINLEDIAQPKCFRILDSLRATMTIPVWHDDQQGTATVLLAGLVNALKVANKTLDKIRIAMVGMGAANVAVYRLLVKAGIDPGAVVACDSKGTLHAGRRDIEAQRSSFVEKWRICTETNPGAIAGGIAEALEGADVCIAFSQSGPGIIEPAWIRRMAGKAVIFACANPVPEIWPWEAAEAGARIVCTGRSDFPNQVNNSLAFPGVFRGVLDIRARTITDEMAIAAATEIARCAEQAGLSEQAILPRMDQVEVVARIAAAIAIAAQEQGVAGLCKGGDTLYEDALATINRAREATHMLFDEGLIPPAPEAVTTAGLTQRAGDKP